jgi:hypothetical protein
MSRVKSNRREENQNGSGFTWDMMIEDTEALLAREVEADRNRSHKHHSRKSHLLEVSLAWLKQRRDTGAAYLA